MQGPPNLVVLALECRRHIRRDVDDRTPQRRVREARTLHLVLEDVALRIHRAVRGDQLPRHRAACRINARLECKDPNTYGRATSVEATYEVLEGIRVLGSEGHCLLLCLHHLGHQQRGVCPRICLDSHGHRVGDTVLPAVDIDILHTQGQGAGNHHQRRACCGDRSTVRDASDGLALGHRGVQVDLYGHRRTSVLRVDECLGHLRSL
ncbi:hypothetical protein D3C86_1135570 [compost metagenome]